jgi:hypothetical protein
MSRYALLLLLLAPFGVRAGDMCSNPPVLTGQSVTDVQLANCGPTLNAGAVSTLRNKNLTSATNTFPGLRNTTLVICPSNAINNNACDVNLTGTADQTLINSTIASCGNANMSAAWTGSVSGTTLTVTSISSGAISPYMDIAGTGITASTFYIQSPFTLTGTGGVGTYALNSTPGTISSEAMTGYNPGLGNGCKIAFRSGTYNLTGHINIDRSFIDLEGENSPMWGSFLGFYNGTTPVGSIGTAGAHLVFTTSTSDDIIQINGVNLPDNAESRHRGIRISGFYMTGFNNSTFSYTTNNCINNNGGGALDFSIIENNMCQEVGVNGFTFLNDTGTVRRNSVQDVSGTGINIPGGSVYTQVYGNLIFDTGSYGLISNAVEPAIYGNKFGDNGNDSILAQGTGGAITGNSFGSTATRAINVAYVGFNISANVIDYTQGNTYTRSLPAIDVTYTGTFGGAAGGSGNLISGNTCRAKSGGEPSGVYCVKIEPVGGGTDAPNHNLVVGNNCYGIGVGWNGNATWASNQCYLDSGTSDTLANNL